MVVWEHFENNIVKIPGTMDLSGKVVFIGD